MHATMTPPHALLLCLLLAAAASPPAAAICVPRKPGAAGKPGHQHTPAPVNKPKPMPTPTPAPPKPKPMPLPAGADIVKSLCLKTDYPDLCVSSIAKQQQTTPPPAGGKRLDGAGVLRLAMAAVRVKAGEAKKAALARAADPRTQPLARGPLDDCVESYGDIEYSLDHAEKAMAAGDRDSTGTMLDTVRTDVDTCDQGFEDREELKPLMAKEDAELAKLSSNCLAIASAAGLR
ncbi:hypothetical protein PR202_gb23478 [Eleusine coracana subsp. coracana]|uniref:Pectinesterase inhibitor domain-containing protein n=1 Tax=Eleusine coracana subsp. coracana TaxID=191504 RepID=A0AAV5FJI9_ELECO|nr:hypothetical protein QOZ80_5BG0442240 [Eleusine coracana subsp. coracana]GJN34782.1 hypothetical protein PR202_gb23478 [Eleusine coracana subsp. coracana]